MHMPYIVVESVSTFVSPLLCTLLAVLQVWLECYITNKQLKQCLVNPSVQDKSGVRAKSSLLGNAIRTVPWTPSMANGVMVSSIIQGVA
jgi:hypothetical protein